ncbi:sensor histidine kinase [Nocardia transvalensis]|uniref:sensor histidine kinase n=1 Tax=Nocardia transvalensis TaxID=37333 RepID=UPI001894E2C6|nr:sensor histidine kinase [Nocardia transvalensis]MBF6332015.1 sensor histidine kinase [Nocardia transvalensis]
MAVHDRREERSFVERSAPWWHAMCAVVLTASAIGFLTAPEELAHHRLLGIGLLALMGLAYILVGHRLLYTDNVRIAVAYTVLLCAATLVLLSLGPAGYLPLLTVFTQLWAMLPMRWAIALTTGLGLCLCVIIVGRIGWTTNAMLVAALAGILVLGSNLHLGVWIHGIADESERRKELIAELRQARSDLAEAHRREGVMSERERLAAEIHDTLAQAFLSILVQAQAADAVADDDVVRERLALIERTARENLGEARSLVAALAPAELHGRTLVDALRRVVERAGRDNGLATHFTIDGEPRTLPVNSEVVLLRAVQEALTNVRKHAQASRVDVRVRYGADGTTLEVRDDGRGFDAAQATGFGLRGMRSRVEQVAGTMAIRTAPGAGTTIRLEVP